ncbi:MAG TPA: FAD-dependent monooxygenase [Steroidobacteraceae bacterium]|nr:FAD-dependent monooxygenase [Steroidobacteraceae bacterium]
MSDVLDVLVVGGGPVGACLAALLARQAGQGATAPFDVAVLEPHRPVTPEANEPIDPRVVAISRASERILRSTGAWAGMTRRLSPYERMRIWHESVSANDTGALVFDAADVGEPNLGYIIENRLLQAALLDTFAARGGRIEAAQLVSLQIGAEVVTVVTSNGTLKARLVVGADGAQSAVRQAVGLTTDLSDYRQTAIVATVATERSHENTAWQRFMHDGTLAFLPLSDGTSSIVWSADNDVAKSLLSSTEFAAELDRASDLALGPTRLVSERSSFPLRRLSAHHYAAQRIALIGDAAHVVHPLAGQGVNLGLLDAAALAQLLAEARGEKEDPGASRVLRQYERWRKSEVALMSTAIDAFDRFLAHGRGPLSRLARRGLGWVNASQELKRLFIARALGTAGELPRVAQRA